ncbi:MAG: flagellar export protein FliJ [Spirochaetes bacterium]|nr:flagellar export protein FliJ [Spirochaetota bacterium]
MKKFVFKLQTLLDIREAKEREVKNELAALLAIQNRERAKQDEYRKKIEDEQLRFANSMREGKFSYYEAIAFERFVEFGHKVIEAAQMRIDSMEEEINKVRVRLVEASRERKVVEKLKERKRNKYLYDLNREINKEHDDANQKMHVRKLRENLK